MQTLAQGAYTDQAVRKVLHGPRVVDFRYELLDADNTFLGAFTTVAQANLKHGALSDIQRTMTMTLGKQTPATAQPGSVQTAVNFARHRIRPWYRLQMIDGGWCEWPLGVFLLSTNGQTTRENSYDQEVECYDQAAVLRQDLVSARVSVVAGTNVITAIVAQLSASNVIGVSVEQTDKTIPTDMEWPPGTSRYDIVADLLNVINYARIWFDGIGKAVLRPYRSPAAISPAYTYADDTSSVTYPQAADTIDLYAVPNRWIATVSEPDRDPLVSVYTNTNAASPTSTVSRGRTVATLVTDAKAVDQVTLDAYVARIASEASQVYRKVSFSTAVMPHHEHLDVLNMQLSTLGVLGSFQETSWEMDLRPGAEMRHEARLLVNV